MALSPQDRRNLAHLLRRAGFGPRPSEWDEWAALGITGATERLLHPERTPDNLQSVQDSIGDNLLDFDEINSVRQWWLFRMANTHRPLEEKMTLFWHTLFATAVYKVGSSRRMWRQNELFRTHALGNFRALLQGVTRDPAMLVWLDGAENRGGAPNENYAREMMELFTMGADSGYTEKDVKEAARSLTGWRFGEGNEPVFDPFAHDDGTKTVLGWTGNWHPDDMIDIVARHPATAQRLCTRLWTWFVGTTPSRATVESLAKIYLDGYEIRPVVAAILNDPAFYSDEAMNARIKSPVELTLGALRAFDSPLTTANRLLEAIGNMGQELFNPPNVGGWHENEGWINSRTLLARINFVSQLVEAVGNRGKIGAMLTLGGGQIAPSDDGTLAPPEYASAEAMIDAVWEALMPGRTMDGATRDALLEFARGGAGAKPDAVKPNQRLIGVVTLAMSAPQYQLA